MRRCVALCDEHQLPLMRAKAQANLGVIAELSGAIPEALRYLEDAEQSFPQPRARAVRAPTIWFIPHLDPC